MIDTAYSRDIDIGQPKGVRVWIGQRYSEESPPALLNVMQATRDAHYANVWWRVHDNCEGTARHALLRSIEQWA